MALPREMTWSTPASPRMGRLAVVLMGASMIRARTGRGSSNRARALSTAEGVMYVTDFNVGLYILQFAGD